MTVVFQVINTGLNPLRPLLLFLLGVQLVHRPRAKVLQLLEDVIMVHGSFAIELAQSKALWQELNAVSQVASGSW